MTPCHHLADYLDRTLPPAQERAFLAHLDQCSSCRTEVHANRQLYALLNHAAAREPVPSGLVSGVEDRLRERRPRRRPVWQIAAAAAAILVVALLAWRPLRGPEQQDRPPEAVVQREPPSISRMPPTARVDVQVETDEPVIVVPVKTSRPNVTIVWLYAASEKARTAEDDSETKTNTAERNGT